MCGPTAPTDNCSSAYFGCMLQTEAEKAAWAISKAEGFELVTINPTFVLGPVISDRADATSILCFKVGPGALAV